MISDTEQTRSRIPLGIWLLMIGLSAILPLTFVWIAYVPPEGTAPTGMHGVDGAVFVTCMRMFATDFFSPFANCHSPLGVHSSADFAAPFFWMYGLVGAVGRALHCSEFMTLGVANGVGGFLYLLAVYLFLREAFPKQANLAFILFTLAGGPGGVLYVVTGALGLHDAPRFDDYFYRYALYQLFEGARPSPVLAMPRLYYTTSMACCFIALTCFLRHIRSNKGVQPLVFAAVLLFVGTFINLRYGPMTWLIVALYLLVDTRRTFSDRLRVGLALLLPVILAWVLGWMMLRRSPTYIEGATTYIRTHMWLSPFLSAVLFHLLIVPRQVVLAVRRLPFLAKIAGCATVGYLATYAILYALYNVYYGNLWLCLDVTSAFRISDPALGRALLGAIWALTRRGESSSDLSDPSDLSDRSDLSDLSDSSVLQGWIALWLVALLAISISAFGQGWFIRFVPERAMIFLGVPIAIAAALGIEHGRTTWPRATAFLVATMIVCGVCAIGVASACFQGVLGYRPGHGPYGYTHDELLTRADADALQSVPGGVVITPVTYGPSFGDVLAQRPNTSAVFGFGSVNLSDRDQECSKQDCHRFFDKTSSEADRKAIVDDWCVDYVYCPDSHPIDATVLTALRNTAWLEEVTQAGEAVVFRVARDSQPQR